MMPRRPVSSPGRVEKYPPPLVRFLRSKSSGGGRSRSRRRSRSSPLFVRRSKSSSSAAAAAAIQEPSSPKVTCMGQVRVRRSKQQLRTSRPGSTGNAKRRCKWIWNALFCSPFAGKLKTRWFNSSWPNRASFSFFHFRRKSNAKENTPTSQPGSRVDPGSVRENERAIEEEEDEDEDEGENFRKPRNPNISVSPAFTPPRNVLLLTRSRSAPPYRSSSLGFRFWEADNNQETDERNNRDEKEEEQREGNPRSEEESVSRNSGQDPESCSETDGKIGGPRESESSIKEIEVKSENKEEEVLGLGFIRPPALTRSKSEPARIGEKLVAGWLLDEGEGQLRS